MAFKMDIKLINPTTLSGNIITLLLQVLDPESVLV